MAVRYTDFACRTCGWGGEHQCVKGKVGSKLWLLQIPLPHWHLTRVNELKNRKRQAKE